MHRARLQRQAHDGDTANDCLIADRESHASNPSSKMGMSPSLLPALTVCLFGFFFCYGSKLAKAKNLHSCCHLHLSQHTNLLFCWTEESNLVSRDYFALVFFKNARCGSKCNAIKIPSGPPYAAFIKQQLIPKNVTRDGLPVQTPQSISRSGPSVQRTGSQQWPSHHFSLCCTWPHRGWRREWGNCRFLATCTWQTLFC